MKFHFFRNKKLKTIEFQAGFVGFYICPHFLCVSKIDKNGEITNQKYFYLNKRSKKI